MSGAESVLQPFSCPRGPLKGAALWGVPVLPTCRQLRARECRRRPQCRRILSWVCIHRLTLSHAFLSSCRKPKYLLIMVLGCNSELFYFPFPSKKGNYNSPSRIFSSLSAQVSLGVSGCSQIPNLYQRPLPHPCSAPAPRSSARDSSGLFFPADRGPHVLHIGSYPGELAIP